MKTMWIFILTMLAASAGPAIADEAPAAAPVNLLPNGSFEIGSAGWLLVEIQMVGTKWGVPAEESTVAVGQPGQRPPFARAPRLHPDAHLERFKQSRCRSMTSS
jgi:hypothetical protein